MYQEMPRLSICSSICCHDTHAVLRCSPVGHAHDDAVHAPPAGHVDQGLQSGDQRLAALQAEALLRRPLPLQELLEPGGAAGGQGLRRGGLQGPSPWRPSGATAAQWLPSIYVSVFFFNSFLENDFLFLFSYVFAATQFSVWD